MDFWGWFQIVRNFWPEKISQLSQNRLKCLISKGILQIYLRFPQNFAPAARSMRHRLLFGPYPGKFTPLIRSRKGAKRGYICVEFYWFVFLVGHCFLSVLKLAQLWKDLPPVPKLVIWRTLQLKRESTARSKSQNSNSSDRHVWGEVYGLNRILKAGKCSMEHNLTYTAARLAKHDGFAFLHPNVLDLGEQRRSVWDPRAKKTFRCWRLQR